MVAMGDLAMAAVRAGAAVTWACPEAGRVSGTAWSAGPKPLLWWVLPAASPTLPRLVQEGPSGLAVVDGVPADWSQKAVAAANKIRCRPSAYGLARHAQGTSVHRRDCLASGPSVHPVGVGVLLDVVLDPFAAHRVCDCVHADLPDGAVSGSTRGR